MDAETRCFRRLERPVRRAAARPASSRSISRRRSSAATGRTQRRDRRDRRRQPRRTSRTRSRRWSAPAGCCRGCRACSTCWPAPHTNEAHPGDRARDRADARAALERDPSERRRCSRGSTHCTPRRALGLTAEQARVLERYHAMFRRAGAGLDAAAKQRLKEIAERLATLGTDLQPERARRRAGLRAAARARTTSPACRTSRKAAARGAARRARPARQARRHAVAAPASSRSCSSRPGATCARRRSAPGSRAATTKARPTTSR